MSPSTAWGVRQCPPACLECGTTEFSHEARGLCARCIVIPGIMERYPKLPRGRVPKATATSDMVDDSKSNENVGPSLPAEPEHDSLGGGGLGEDPREVNTGQVVEAPEPAVPGSRERRPGGVMPSSPADAPGTSRGKGRLARLFGNKQREESTTAPPTQTRERTPKARGRRVSGAETISDAWSGIGSLAARNPSHLPLGRYMQFQAPVAGEMLDEAASGTVVDKVVLQPIVKARGRFDLLAAVFGPPALIVAIERNPERSELLMPMLKSSIRNALPLMVPAIKRVTAKEKATVKAAEDLFDDDEGYREYVRMAESAGHKVDPADYILSSIFDGWAPPAPAPTQPSEEAPVP